MLPFRPLPPTTRGKSLFLLRDHEVLDLIVSGLRNDLLVDQFILSAIWPALDNLIGVGVPIFGSACSCSAVAELMSTRSAAFVVAAAAAFFASFAGTGFWAGATASENASSSIITNNSRSSYVSFSHGCAIQPAGTWF
jgi:hypothetical protein